MANSDGQSSISTLIYIAAAILVVYVIIKIVPVYLHYYSMDDEAYHQIEMSRINDASTIRKDLIEKAAELDIPVDPADIELTYDENERLSIYMYWEETVDFGYGVTRDYEFEIEASAVKSKE